MKVLQNKFKGFILAFALLFAVQHIANGQCAMCSLNAENSTQHGNTQGRGLNNGILFLLGAPFLIGGGIAILWYKKFRSKPEKPSVF